MKKILPCTDYIFEDEPCLILYESDVQAPDNSGMRRYLCYRVIRNGRLTEYREDMGSIEKFRGIEPVVIPGGLPEDRPYYWHKVGELREILDQYRHHVRIDTKELVGVDNIRLR